MRAFFGGDYRQAVATVNDIEQSLGAPLSSRGYFYRACGLAGEALRGATCRQEFSRRGSLGSHSPWGTVNEGGAPVAPSATALEPILPPLASLKYHQSFVPE